MLTLPANVTYFTYQLRLMFINSTQPRAITDLCPIQVSSAIGSLTPQSENGTIGGFPVVVNGTGSFSNITSGSWTPHHWSQLISGTKGTGIMFTDNSNMQLYAFDSIAGNPTGVLSATSTSLIELLPVKLSQAQFTYPLDITWCGAVATFDGTTPIYASQGQFDGHVDTCRVPANSHGDLGWLKMSASLFGFRIIQNADSHFTQVKYKIHTFSIQTKGTRKMSTRKILNSKKAISPILATLLLIVIAVAAIVVTYAWISTYMGTTTQQAGVLLYKANVNFFTDGVTKKIAIDIGNSGTSNTQILQVYIGTSATSATSQTTTPATPIPLNAGAIASFNVTYTWAAGQTYYFRIVPTAGQQALPLQEQAPQ